MTILTDRIGEARRRFVEAKQTARDAQNDRADYEIAFKATIGYSGLGSNKEAREIAMADALLKDIEYQALLNAERAWQKRLEDTEAELECLLDERRVTENETWAKLADYLAGRVDHVGYAPTQAARQATQEEALTAGLEKARAKAKETLDKIPLRPEPEYKAPF